MGDGGRQQEVMERDTEQKGVGRGARERERDSCLNNDIMFSTYLIWHP